MTKKKGMVVNDRLQTTNPRIYAAGDVCMQLLPPLMLLPYCDPELCSLARKKTQHTDDALVRMLVGNCSCRAVREKMPRKKGDVNTFLISMNHVDQTRSPTAKRGLRSAC